MRDGALFSLLLTSISRPRILIQNKKAWEFNVYNFWIKEAGSPAERAQKDMENPKGMLKKYSSYFDTYEGIRIANICGSCG